MLLRTDLSDFSLQQVNPIIEIIEDGKPRTVRCQPVTRRKLKARVGDTVNVYVTSRKVMGLTAVSAIIDDGSSFARHINILRYTAGITYAIGTICIVSGIITIFICH